MAFPTTISFKHEDPEAGLQPIDQTSTTQNHPIGHVVKAKDATYGEGEFVYLKGVASTIQGDVCYYDQYASTTARSGAGSRGPFGIAMSANVASQYGWYMVRGSILVNCLAADTTTVTGQFNTATAGSLDDAIVAGDKVDGLSVKTTVGTPAAGFCVAQLHYPSANGNG